MRTFLLSVVMLVASLSGAVSQAQEGLLPFHQTSIQLASVKQARSILATPDRFLTTLSRFDLQSRLRTSGEVTSADLAAFAAQQALAWQPDEMEKLRTILTTISGKLEGYELPFPEPVGLIKTTGLEEGGAAYCRQNAVVLPQTYVNFAPQRLEAILIHELFHILSSHNPRWRHALYEIVGFRPCPPIELPAPLQARKITNPDAPSLDVYVELQDEGQQRLAVPVLYASVENYDPEQGGSFFRYLVFRLLVVRRQADSLIPIEVDGQPHLLDPANVASYHRQIGGNTRTIIHPEEILADNFSHLIRGSKDLPTPDLIDRLRNRLQQTDP